MPSGLSAKMMKISRPLTRLVIVESVPYSSVSQRSRTRACSVVKCSRAWCRASMRTSGSASSSATLSLTLAIQMSRSW